MSRTLLTEQHCCLQRLCAILASPLRGIRIGVARAVPRSPFREPGPPELLRERQLCICSCRTGAKERAPALLPILIAISNAACFARKTCQQLTHIAADQPESLGLPRQAPRPSAGRWRPRNVKIGVPRSYQDKHAYVTSEISIRRDRISDARPSGSCFFGLIAELARNARCSALGLLV